MIEWRYELAPLSIRDAGANNLAEVLDFHPRRRNVDDPPDYDVAPFVSQPCGSALGPRTR